jgi:hypothetical protein
MVCWVLATSTYWKPYTTDGYLYLFTKKDLSTYRPMVEFNFQKNLLPLELPGRRRVGSSGTGAIGCGGGVGVEGTVGVGVGGGAGFVTTGATGLVGGCGTVK